MGTSPDAPGTVWSSARPISTGLQRACSRVMPSLASATPTSRNGGGACCWIVWSNSSTLGSRGISGSLLRESGGLLPSPRVVGFAAWRAHQLVEQEHLPRHLVARHLGAAVGNDIV